jgi:hypothetical protein
LIVDNLPLKDKGCAILAWKGKLLILNVPKSDFIALQPHGTLLDRIEYIKTIDYDKANIIGYSYRRKPFGPHRLCSGRVCGIPAR